MGPSSCLSRNNVFQILRRSLQLLSQPSESLSVLAGPPDRAGGLCSVPGGFMVCWEKTLGATGLCWGAAEEQERGDVGAEVLLSWAGGLTMGPKFLGVALGRKSQPRPFTHLVPRQSGLSEDKFALPKHLCKMLGIRVLLGEDPPCPEGSLCHGRVSVGAPVALPQGERTAESAQGAVGSRAGAQCVSRSSSS